MDFETRLRDYKKCIDDGLDACFKPCGFPFDGLLEAMDYSLTAGGKRIRPILTLEFCRACGGDIDAAFPAACAIEMLHTYSLIHDDLPCMDNDELRRGKPTCHVAYGEATAVIAGDALQAEAFGTILRSPLPAHIRAACAEELAGASGVDGMCGGQFMDTVGEGKTLTDEELTDIHSRKTAALLIAACRMGVIIAGATPERLDAASFFGAAIGAAFQIRDDMLDVLSTDEELGKPVGSDKAGKKTTFMDIYGEEKCRDMINRLTEAAKKSISAEIPEPEFLCELAEMLSGRKN